MTLLRLNEAVTFGKTGSIRDMEPYGIDLSEPTMSWTHEEVAGFSVALADAVPLDAVLHLNISGRPFIQAGKVDRQQFFVFINGVYVGFRSLTAAADIQFRLPRNVLSPRRAHVEFAIPTAAAPKGLGIGKDLRKLGLALTTVSLTLSSK